MIQQSVVIDYTNYRGVRGERVISPPFRLYWGSTEHHPEPQHLLDAWDLEKQAYRTFAVKDIHSWKPEYPT